MNDNPQDPSGPLTYDDLIDLHYLLEADELFLQLMAAGVKVREAA
jgi:hypothetical protein